MKKGCSHLGKHNSGKQSGVGDVGVGEVEVEGVACLKPEEE